MTVDLGAGEGEVHDAARAVLRFWFDEVKPEQRFAKDDALDRIIADRFGTLRDAVLANGALGWRSEPEHLLAAIILLDQFSRNIHRGTAQAFAADPLARSLTREALERGWLATYRPEARRFVLMPLMHSESASDQADSVRLFADLEVVDGRDFAAEHAQVIARYGRFPGRNAALGRASTAEEEIYLSRPDAGW